MKAFSEENPAAILAQIEPADPDGQSWNTGRLDSLLDAYFAEHARIRLDPEARAAKHTRISDDEPRRWACEQVLVDPEELNDWSLKLVVDLDRSDAEQRPVLMLGTLEALV